MALNSRCIWRTKRTSRISPPYVLNSSSDLVEAHYVCVQAAGAWGALCAHCTEVNSRVTGLGVSDVQGNMQAGSFEVNCQSSFFLVAIRECGYQCFGAFPRMLLVPPDGLQSTITESAVERGHGSLWNNEGFWALLHLLLAAHPCAERQRSDKLDWMHTDANTLE